MPRRGKKSIAKKKCWDAKLAHTDSPNSCTEVDEGTQETFSPAMEPLVETAQQHAQFDVEEQENIGEAMDLSNNDPVLQACTVPPSVKSVQASKSQDHHAFSDMSKNRQCTCMALTFLAHQHEGLDFKMDDLDKILDMGDSLYKRTIAQLKRQKLFRLSLLTMEETPLKVETKRNTYSVTKGNIDMGYMRAEGEPHQRHWWLKLQERLQCLSEDVKYALLTVSPHTIAVFRDGSGRYGLFDSHQRSADGLPLSGGKSVMMTFSQLDDLWAKIDQVIDFSHSRNIDKMQFDFMPVTFEQTNARSPHLSTTQVTPDNLHQKEPVDLTSQDGTNTGPPMTTHSLQAGHAPSTKVSSDTKDYGANKVNKQRKKKMMRRQIKDQLQSDNKDKHWTTRKEYMNKYIAMRCITNAKFKEQQNKFKKACANRRISQDVVFSWMKKAYGNRRYNENEEFRRQHQVKQKEYEKMRRKDEEFRQKKQAYDNRRYNRDEVLRGKKKAYVNKRFREDEEFREKVGEHMKSYMARRCKTDPFFKMRRDIRRSMRIRNRYKDLCDDLRKRGIAVKAMKDLDTARIDLPTAPQQNELLQGAIASFQKVIKHGPTFVCTTCHRTLFSDQVYVCHRSNYTIKPRVVAACLTGKYLHSCDDQCGGPEDCTVPEERRKEWICQSCHNSVVAGRMPRLAVANNLELAPIPPELRQLNVLERQISAIDIPFAKILTLPKGKQSAIYGAVVCVPADVETTVNTLPRRLDSSRLYRVKLKRRLRYKGYHLFHTVNMTNVLLGLRKLIETHPDYKNITIRDDESINDENVEGHLEDLPTVELEDLPTVEQTGTDEVMDSCDDAEMMEVADATETLDPSQRVDQHPPTAQDEQDALRPGHGLDSCLEPDDIGQETMTYGDGIFCIAPAEGNRPVSYSTAPNLEARAFPTLFPTGENTLDRKRKLKLTPSRYFNARLFNVDDRFARDQSYLFFAQFVTETHLAKNTISIQLRKGKPFTKDGRRISNKMLQDKHEVERLVRNRDATRFMQPLRGTPAYWQKTMYDLFAMVRQLGPPTFFLTLSAAEFRWPEVITAIKAQQGQIVDFDKLDWNEKCDILRSNAVTTMRMFDKRVHSAYSKLLRSDARPIGHVIDWFHRIEYQNRGSPHVHALMWVADAPKLGEDSDEKICEFADRYISCQLPDPNENPVLHRIVQEVQMHSKNHTKSCKKGNKTCRFGFPKAPVDTTWLTNPTPVDPMEEVTDENERGATGGNEGANESAKRSTEGIGKQQRARAQAALAKLKPLYDLLLDLPSELTDLSELLAKCNLTHEEYDSYLEDLRNVQVLLMKRGVKDCYVNNYNPVLLEAWNANMDIQFVLDHFVCISYMLSYISKAEHEMGELLKQVVEGIDPTKVTERGAMNELVHAYVKNRQVSSQEAVARTCSLQLKECSREVVFLPTDDNAMKMSLPLSLLQKRPADSNQVWMSGLLDKYNARPKTLVFDNMCLAEFASEYRIVYGSEAKKPDCLKLSDNMGTIKKRSTDGRPAVIRYAKFSEQKDPEKYFGNLLKAYLPHRYQTTLKTAIFPTYKEFYDSASVKIPGQKWTCRANAIVDENKMRYEKHSKSMEEALEEFMKHGPAEDAWANIAPENELERMECLAEQDQDPQADDEQDDVPEFSCQEVGTIVGHRVSAPQMSLDYLRSMCRNLNRTQASIFHSVREWCFKSVLDQKPEPFFFFVTGGAGTGKSHLIKCIYGEATRILRRLPRLFEETDASMPTVLLSAFTGTAAYNIAGNTLHSLLKLPRKLKPPYIGLGNKLDDVRAKLGNAEIIVIDEVSMISKAMFIYIHWRLQEIKGSKRPFGGMSVLVVGDFYQLPPTSSGKPLCVLEEGKPDLLLEHFQMITLTEIMRQKDDLPYAELLNRLRVKAKKDPLSDGDKALLAQRVTVRDRCPKDVVHIFATNKEVSEHNAKSLSALHSHIVNIPAEDYKQVHNHKTRLASPCTGEQNDLLDNLQVAEGAPIVIIRNIDVEDGLVNGTFGKMASVEMHVNEDGSRVAKLWLVVDKPEAGQKYRKTTPGSTQVYVERYEEHLSNNTLRRQFPIKLAYACTAHKVQGMTTQSAVVSLKRIFQPGMAYVALSRTTSLQGLHIIDFDAKKIYADPAITAALESMKTASLDSVMPLLKYRETTGQAQTLAIVHHNTQSLPAHIQDIKKHHELTHADVLCLTETHLTGSFVADSLQLDGYTMFSRNKHISYTSRPERAEQNGGGVAVYVKDHFQACEKRYLHNVTNLEFVVVKIESPVKLLIAAVYRPPRYDDPFMENLKALLDSLEVMDHHPIVVCGDFNENLLASVGTPIAMLLESRGYTQLIKEKTTDKNTLLDHIYISRPEQCLQSGVLRTYYSYHDPVYCVLSSDQD